MSDYSLPGYDAWKTRAPEDERWYQGDSDKDDNVCPECGTDFTQPHLGPELKLLVEIADYLQGWDQDPKLARRFIGPLESFNKIKAEERV